MTSTAAALTITLPPLINVPQGKLFTIKDESGGCAANNITIDGDGAETIDGAATYVMANNYESITLYAVPGTGWYII